MRVRRPLPQPLRFPWSLALFCALLALFGAGAARADELTLYFYPSPGLDWSSPRTLGHAAIANTLSGKDHAIGHVDVEVSCADGTGLMAGATGAEADATRELVLREGYGLGLLFHDFPDGRLYSRAEIAAGLPGRYANGALSFVTLRISPETCARLVQYHHEYVAGGYDHHYGLANRPLHREGAGCTAFGVSFLEVAGLLDPALEAAFARNFTVPPNWVGGPLTGGFIPLRRFFNPLWPSRWAGAGEPGFFIHFYDADLMDAWVRGVHSGTAPLPALPLMALDHRGRAPGVVLDGRGIATPRGAIWQD